MIVFELPATKPLPIVVMLPSERIAPQHGQSALGPWILLRAPVRPAPLLAHTLAEGYPVGCERSLPRGMDAEETQLYGWRYGACLPKAADVTAFDPLGRQHLSDGQRAGRCADCGQCGQGASAFGQREG